MSSKLVPNSNHRRIEHRTVRPNEFLLLSGTNICHEISKRKYVAALRSLFTGW